MSTQGAIEEQPGRGASSRLVPIADASRRLRRSVWTLKRLYTDGDLPVAIIRNLWFVPESFIDLHVVCLAGLAVPVTSSFVVARASLASARYGT